MDTFRELAAACRWVVESSALVEFDEVAVDIPPELRQLPPWDDDPFAEVSDEQALAWLVAYNAVNFSYWPDSGPRWYVQQGGVEVGRDDEALAIMAVFACEPVHDVDWLGTMDEARLGRILAPAPGAGVLPLLDVRAAALRELGAALRAHGPVARWVEEARGSAVAFAQGLARRLPSWSDRRTFRGRPLHFLKRAQLCTAMIHGRLRGEPFRDVEQLTAFADYRLPQILQGLGLLRLAPSLSASIEAGELLAVDSEPEVALRAAAIDGAERLAASTGLSTLVIDHFLWRTAVARQDELPAHHCTRCTDY
jgi:hypothetical protein